MVQPSLSGISRRQLLIRAGALTALAAGAPLLSACGSAEPARTSVGGPLRMLTWEGYDLPTISKDWRAANGVDVQATYTGSNDEIVSKTAAGGQSGAALDLVTYNQGYGQQYDSLDLLQPIDASKLANYDQLFPFFRSEYKNFWIREDGSIRGVPYVFNWNGLTYDSSIMPAPESYDVVLDPKWKGKLAITEDVATIYQMAAHVVGVDPNMMDDNAFAKVEAWISALLGQARGLSPTYGDMATKLVSGDAAFAFPGWAGMNILAAQSGKPTVKTLLPREGGITTSDAWAIPRSATNVVTAYAWIDFTLEPATSAQMATSLNGGTPVQAAVPQLPPEVSEGYDYTNLDNLFEKAPLFALFPLESDRYKTLQNVLDSWTQLKTQA